MGKMKDITGHVYGRLTVISPSCKDARGRWKWNCLCECGNECVVASIKLRDKNRPTRSCGCLQLDTVTTHGCSQKDVSSVYYGILARCYNPEADSYFRYGGRGIVVCEEWKNDMRSFVDWAGNSGYKKGLTIERIDNDGNYCPENCRWATPKEQANNRSNNKLITYKGETKILGEWDGNLGVAVGTIGTRLLNGWSIERALTEPLCNKKMYTTEDGRAHTIPQWAELTGVSIETLRARIKKYGWSIDRAVSEPTHNTGRKKPL